MAEVIKARRRAEFRKKSANIERQPTDTATPDDRLENPEKSANDNSLAWPLIPFPDGWLSG
jgi:hypothetical protein